MGTNRLETFADGVFAIAATLLILNVDAQVGAVSDIHGSLAHDVVHAWPSYLGYVVSFVTIGVIWANHHTVMTQIERVDRTFLLLSVGFLMCVAFIPFPTRLRAEFIREGDDGTAATVAYGATLSLTAAFFNAIWLYASRGARLLREDADPTLVAGITKSYRPGVPIYVVATLVGFASPVASAILYAAIAVFYVVESSVFGRGRERAGASEHRSG
jgi:TMEM175 potassium channel family protein